MYSRWLVPSPHSHSAVTVLFRRWDSSLTAGRIHHIASGPSQRRASTRLVTSWTWPHPEPQPWFLSCPANSRASCGPLSSKFDAQCSAAESLKGVKAGIQVEVLAQCVGEVSHTWPVDGVSLASFVGDEAEASVSKVSGDVAGPLFRTSLPVTKKFIRAM
jgi:hypothetical protein